MNMKNYKLIISLLVLLSIGCSNNKKEWEKAKMLDSIPIYKEYLEKFPNGLYADSAKNKIESRQLAIYSIPDSLSVYLNLPELIIPEDGWVKIDDVLGENELFKVENKKGTTPLKIDDIDSGEYIIGIQPVEFWDSNLKSQCIDPFLKYVVS